MIKARNNTFGFRILTLICLSFSLWFCLGLSKFLFGIGINFRNGETMHELKSDLLLFLGITIFWYCILFALVRNIIIDVSANRISFQNIFTRRTKIYFFSDFDGYIEVTISHDSSLYPYKAIGFIKNKRVVRRIDSYYYSNFDDLKSGLKEMEYLGHVKMGFIKRTKMLLKCPVL